MDELQKAWNEIKTETGKFTTVDRTEVEEAIHVRSKGPIGILRKKLRIKWYFCLLFTVLIAVGIPFVQVLASKILLLVLLAAYLIGDILLYQEDRILKKGIDMGASVKESLNLYYKRIRDVLKYEELIGLTLYPVSITAGFFIGMRLGDPTDEIMNETRDWVALVISVLVFTPLSHLLARWMNKVAFGKYLKELKKNINELENL